MDPSTLDDVMNEQLIALQEPPAEKRAVIEFLLDLADDAGRIEDREQTLADVLEREASATTGVGMGIGIPHAKSAGVREPTIAFTRSSQGVDFEGMDGEPATLLFMLLVPAEGDDQHLTMLSSLSRALMHEDVRDALHEADAPEDVLATLEEAVA